MMATREPRRTMYRIRWHKVPTADGTPKWYGEMGGVSIADAAMTGRAGVDDYPWDWGLTDAGRALATLDGPRVKHSGVCDTLRSVKADVDWLMRPRP
jgi:hypothetical protein